MEKEENESQVLAQIDLPDSQDLPSAAASLNSSEAAEPVNDLDLRPHMRKLVGREQHGTPDSIILKLMADEFGSFSQEELNILRRHPAYRAERARRTNQILDRREKLEELQDMALNKMEIGVRADKEGLFALRVFESITKHQTAAAVRQSQVTTQQTKLTFDLGGGRKTLVLEQNTVEKRDNTLAFGALAGLMMDRAVAIEPPKPAIEVDSRMEDYLEGMFDV